MMTQMYIKVVVLILVIVLSIIFVCVIAMIIISTYQKTIKKVWNTNKNNNERSQIFYYDEDKDNVYYCEGLLCGNGFSKDQPYCQGCGKANEWKHKYDS